MLNNNPQEGIKKGKLSVALILLLTILSHVVHAQITSWNHIHFTTKNGLPNNSVRNCVQDKDGFIWIATESGLCRFDGDEFKSVFHDPNDSTSIPSDYINHIAMAEDGHLLVSTMNGFFIMNTKTTKGKTIQLLKRKGWEKLENTFGHIHIHDELKQIIVYNSTSIHYFDYNFNLLHSIEYPYPSNSKPLHFLVGRMCYLPNGDIIFWSGLNQQFEYLDFQKKQFTTCNNAKYKSYSNLNNIKNVNNFNWDSENNLWFCINGIDSLFCYHANMKKRISAHLKGELKNINWTSTINFPDSQTVLMPYAKWDANLLYEFSRTDFIHNSTFQINPTSFSGFTVALSSLFVDKDKNWWITSLDGLYFLRKQYSNFERIDLPVPYKRKFDWQYVTNMHFMNADEILITTFAEHCFLYNQKNNSIKSFLDSVPINRAWNHCMYGILQLGKNRSFISGCSNYLYENNQLTFPFKPQNKFEEMLANHETIGFIHDNQHNLWVSLADIGLVKYNYITWQYQIYPPDSTFTSDKFQLTSYDKKGNIYFVTRSNAIIWKYDSQKNSFAPIRIQDKKNPIDWIRDIAVDEKQQIYLNTHQNLTIYSQKDKSIRTLLMSDGLPSNVLNAIFYYNHKLYLSSNSGLGIMNTDNYSLRIVSEKDGILDNATSGYINYDTLSKRLYIGGKGCVYRIHPDSCWLIPAAANIIIDKLTINNQPYVYLDKELNLKHTQNNVRIDLSSIDYLSGTNKKYYFKIIHSGTNQHWQQSATKQIHLLNLSPGSYEIEFRSKDAENHWSDNTATLKFNILSPWYQRWWFYAIMTVVIIGTVYLIYRNKINQLKRIEMIRAKLSRDLHDDIGSTLSSINILSNTATVIARSNNDIKTSNVLEKINERSQRLLQNMSDIIWNIKPENDSFDELLSRMRAYAASVLEAKSISYTLQFLEQTKGIQLNMNTKSNFYLIFKEAINNLVKYSQCKNASIILKINKNKLELTIQDDGIGFNLQDLPRKGGLNNMQFRADDIHAQLNIVSAIGEGTRIELILPL